MVMQIKLLVLLLLLMKREGFYRKNELHMFLLISGGHVGALKRYTNMASPYKLYDGAWNVSASNSETVGH